MSAVVCPRCGRAQSASDLEVCAWCASELRPACRACGHRGEIGARFCSACGAALRDAAAPAPPTTGSPPSTVEQESAMPPSPVLQAAGATPERALHAASAPPSPGAHTPRHLAERILGQRAALEGERKQVTVLFVDMKGSMAIASEVDPEEWHAVMDRFFVIASGVVHRWEGTVNQYAGDGIMALFGAPLALEDHAERACHAALDLTAELARASDELVRERGYGFAVRTGLHSGEVVVGRIGDDLRMEYTAQGHTVGLAARMEQLAPPGRIYLTEATAALIGGRFALHDLGPREVRGVREPVRVRELLGRGELRTRLDEARMRGLSRLVGRAAESQRLDAALVRAIAGAGSVVALSGEAGVGKSRLAFELVQRARAQGVVVHETHALPYGRTVAFQPARELLRSLLGIGAGDSTEHARRKVADALAALARGFDDVSRIDGGFDDAAPLDRAFDDALPLDRAFDEALPLVLDFLGIGDDGTRRAHTDPDARRQRLVTVAGALLRAAARHAPQLILVEDVHWLDGASETFLRGLAHEVGGSRVLLLVDFRPEYDASWLSVTPAERIELEALEPEGSGELLRALVGDDPSLRDLVERITERTAGNPFFLEEAVRALVGAGRLVGERGAYRASGAGAELVLPATVQAVLAARIDALPEDAKTLLHTAAVIGRSFDRDVLRRVAGSDDATTDRLLDILLRAEFVQPGARDGRAGTTYAFAHPLTHEVAYRTQLAVHREQVHAAVARVLEEIWADRAQDIAALLAHHHEHGGDRLAAARWSRIAAERATRTDVAESMRLWSKARDLVAALPDGPETLEIGIWSHIQLLNLGWRCGLDDESARHLFESGLALAARASDASATSGVLVTYGALRGLAGDSRAALELVTEAARLARESDDLGARIATQAALVQTQIMAGRLRAARTELESALASVSDHPGAGNEQTGFDTRTWLLAMRGQLRTETGELPGAQSDLGEALERARVLGELETLGWTHEMQSYLARWHGDDRGALAHADEAVRIAERTGSAFSQTSAYGTRALAHRLVGRWDEARASFARVLELMRVRGSFRHWEAVTLSYLGETEVMLGTHDAGLARVRRGLELATVRGARFVELVASVVLVRALVAARGADALPEAAPLLARATELIDATGAASWVSLVAMEEHRLARLAGDEAAAARMLARAREAFAAIGAYALARAAGERDLPYV